MFITHNKVRMHDTDMAGILYFARQFRFAHDALEDFMEHEGIHFHQMFKSNEFAFVIAHVEADYKVSVTVGDELEVHLITSHIGETSFSIFYKIYRMPEQILIGTVKTVHVTVDPNTRKKIPIPQQFREMLEKYREKHLSR